MVGIAFAFRRERDDAPCNHLLDNFGLPIVAKGGNRLVKDCAQHRRRVGIRPERLASLITLSHEPMFAWRLDGQIEFWNTGATRLYGFAADEAVGYSSHALLQTKFPIELSALRSQLLDEGYWSGELRHVCKDGSRVIVDARMQLLAALPPRSLFDVILSSPPKHAGEPRDLADRGWHAGPQYRDVAALFEQARERLKPNGCLYVMLSSDSDLELLG
jgi:PAS domain S-box-containing protein